MIETIPLPSPVVQPSPNAHTGVNLQPVAPVQPLTASEAISFFNDKTQDENYVPSDSEHSMMKDIAKSIQISPKGVISYSAQGERLNSTATRIFLDNFSSINQERRTGSSSIMSPAAKSLALDAFAGKKPVPRTAKQPEYYHGKRDYSVIEADVAKSALDSFMKHTKDQMDNTVPKRAGRKAKFLGRKAGRAVKSAGSATKSAAISAAKSTGEGIKSVSSHSAAAMERALYYGQEAVAQRIGGFAVGLGIEMPNIPEMTLDYLEQVDGKTKAGSKLAVMPNFKSAKKPSRTTNARPLPRRKTL
jgi:hypothetical protein